MAPCCQAIHGLEEGLAVAERALLAERLTEAAIGSLAEALLHLAEPVVAERLPALRLVVVGILLGHPHSDQPGSIRTRRSRRSGSRRWRGLHGPAMSRRLMRWGRLPGFGAGVFQARSRMRLAVRPRAGRGCHPHARRSVGSGAELLLVGGQAVIELGVAVLRHAVGVPVECAAAVVAVEGVRLQRCVGGVDRAGGGGNRTSHGVLLCVDATPRPCTQGYGLGSGDSGRHRASGARSGSGRLAARRTRSGCPRSPAHRPRVGGVRKPPPMVRVASRLAPVNVVALSFLRWLTMSSPQRAA